MNKEWHAQHKLPREASPLARIAWHQAHQKHCGCQPIPAAIKKLIPPNASADQA